MYTEINMLRRQKGGAESAKCSSVFVQWVCTASVQRVLLHHSVCLTAVKGSRLFCRFCCSSLNRWSRSSASKRICFKKKSTHKYNIKETSISIIIKESRWGTERILNRNLWVDSTNMASNQAARCIKWFSVLIGWANTLTVLVLSC